MSKRLTRQQIIDGLRVHAGRVSEDGYHTRAIYMNAAIEELEATPPAGNNRLKRTMEFDLADAPMLMAAVRLAACTAMMCGHKAADKKLRVYQQFFTQFLPEAAARFDEEAWAEIGMALLDAKEFRVTIEPKRWERDRSWWYDGVLTVYVGTKRFEADKGAKPYIRRGDDDAPRALYEALVELAPMDCQGAWDNAKENA